MSSSNLLEALQVGAVPAVLDRRSVHLLLERLWHESRSEFWNKLLALMAPGTPGLSRVVAAESVARLVRSDDDLVPLLASSRNKDTQELATHAIRYIAGYVASDPAAVQPAVWIRWCLAGSTATSEIVRASLGSMLFQIWSLRNDDLAEPARRDAAESARTLLSTSIASNAPLHGLHLVIDTLSVDPLANAEVLRSFLASTCRHPQKDEALALMARQADELLADAELVGALYIRAMHAEADEEARQQLEFGPWYEEAQTADAEGVESPSLPSRGRVHADIDDLQHHAHKFVASAPAIATQVIIEGLRYHDARTKGGVADTVEFSIDGVKVVVPNRPPGRLQHPMHLVEHLSQLLVNVLGESDNARYRAMMQIFVSAPAPESLWSLIIETATEQPRLRGVAAALLTMPETLRLFSDSAEALIRGWSTDMPPDLQAHIASSAAKLIFDADTHTRRRLESALRSIGNVVEEHAEPTSEVDQNHDDGDDDIVAIAGDNHGALDIARFNLASEDLAVETNQRLRAAKQAARNEDQKVEAALQARTPETSVETDTSIEAIDTLRSALDEPDGHPALVVDGWCTLSRLASLVVTVGDPRASSVVFEAATRNESIPWNGDGSFTDLLNAGQVIIRAEAVRGLVALAARDDERALEELERLARDVEPAVRFQVAWRLHEIRDLDATRMWALIECLVEDSSIGVVAAAVRRLRAFFPRNKDRALALANQALARLSGENATERDARGDLLLQISWYHLARGEEVSGRAMDRVLAQFPMVTAGLDRLLHSYRDWLTMGAEGEELEAAARARTIELFKRIAAGSIRMLRSPFERDPNAQQRSERSPHAVLLEQLAFQLYFASGAFRRKEGDREVSVEVVARFYSDVKDLLLDVGLAGSNAVAGRVLDTLEHFYNVSKDTHRIPAREILNSFVAVAATMVRDGVADDVWLLTPVEHVLRRCVAERDPSLYDEAMLSSWSRIIDPLLEKGWKQAFLLARDLDVTR